MTICQRFDIDTWLISLPEIWMLLDELEIERSSGSSQSAELAPAERATNGEIVSAIATVVAAIVFLFFITLIPILICHSALLPNAQTSAVALRCLLIERHDECSQ